MGETDQLCRSVFYCHCCVLLPLSRTLSCTLTTVTVLPTVMSQVMSSDVTIRHGSVLAIAELVEALTAEAEKNSKCVCVCVCVCACACMLEYIRPCLSSVFTHCLHRTMLEYLGEEVVSTLKGIPGRLTRADYIRGISGDVMRPAVLVFIQKMSNCHLVFSDTPEDKSCLSK